MYAGNPEHDLDPFPYERLCQGFAPLILTMSLYSV